MLQGETGTSNTKLFSTFVPNAHKNSEHRTHPELQQVRLRKPKAGRNASLTTLTEIKESKLYPKILLIRALLAENTV